MTQRRELCKKKSVGGKYDENGGRRRMGRERERKAEEKERE